MKKLASLIAFGLIFAASLQLKAQDQGQIRVNGSFALGTKSGLNDSGSSLGAGINFGGDYFFLDNMSAGFSYTYFFRSSHTLGPIDISQRISSFNIDGKYYFLDHPVHVYGLMGFSVLSSSNYVNGTTTSNSELGLNLGAGIVYPISDKFALNGQLKFNTPIEQFVLNLGVCYAIK